MKLRHVLLITALAALTACSGLRQRESDRQTLQRYTDYAGAPVKSITYLGRFDSWRPLSRNQLVVWTGINDAYLLTVDEPCLDLQFTDRIGLTSTVGSVSSGFDYVKVNRHERCRIAEIRPVDYKRLRQAERAEHAAASPQSDSGS